MTTEFTPSNPRYPNVRVKLTGSDGNAFFIIAKVRAALRAKKVSEEVLHEFSEQAMSGDYDNVLRTCMCWVNVR